jgi:hypothetical protein
MRRGWRRISPGDDLIARPPKSNLMTELDDALDLLGIAMAGADFQIGVADDLSAGAFRRASLEGAMFGLAPAPTKRVHDPSRVATHGVALWSAGDSQLRSARIVMALLVSRLAADPRFASRSPMRPTR